MDRIGQKAEKILCYSFLPADGVERIIRLRARVRQRLQENAEVVGTDEAFFEDDRNDQVVRDLFTRRPASSTATTTPKWTWPPTPTRSGRTPSTATRTCRRSSRTCRTWSIATKPHAADRDGSRTACWSTCAPPRATTPWPGWTSDGNSVTESQFAILKAAECAPDTPALPRLDNHHDLVSKAVELIVTEEKTVGGQLGRPSGARFRTYERLKRYADEIKGTLFDYARSCVKAIEDIYSYPLRQTATDTLNRQLRSGITDEDLAELVIALREEDRLCLIHEEEADPQEPQIICSLGLSAREAEGSSHDRSTSHASANCLQGRSTSKLCSSRNSAGTATRPALPVAVDGQTYHASAPSPRSAACRSSSVRASADEPIPDYATAPQDRAAGRQVRPRAPHHLHRRRQDARRSGNGSSASRAARCLPRAHLSPAASRATR